MKYKFNKFGLELLLQCKNCDTEKYYQLLSIFGIVPHYIKCLNCNFNIQLDINQIYNNILSISDHLKSSDIDYESDIAGVITSLLIDDAHYDFYYEGVSLVKCAEWEFYPHIKNLIIRSNNE